MSGGGSRVSINGMSVVSRNNGSYEVTGNQSVAALGGGSVISNGVPLSDLMKGGQASPAKAQPRPKQILELRNSTVENVILRGKWRSCSFWRIKTYRYCYRWRCKGIILCNFFIVFYIPRVKFKTL